MEPTPSACFRRRRIGVRPLRKFGLRKGAATLDYVLVLGAALPLAGLALYQSGRIIRAVYAFACTFIVWPFQ